MDEVSIADAKDHLEDLIARVARGEDVRITDPRHGTVKLLPMPREADLTAARVTDTMEPFVPLQHDRIPGRWKGKWTTPESVFAPMTDDELKSWYGDDV
jgi:prevent-host-death family protein